MNKKFLIIVISALAVILIAGYFVFQYSTQIKQNSTPVENQYNQSPAPQIQIQPGDIEINGKNGKDDGFTICLDKCGDNICQATDPSCKDNQNKMNCICPETPQECQQDCK